MEHDASCRQRLKTTGGTQKAYAKQNTQQRVFCTICPVAGPKTIKFRFANTDEIKLRRNPGEGASPLTGFLGFVFCFFLPKASLNHGHGLGDEVNQAPRLTSLLLPPVPHCETDSFWFGSVSQTAGD